MDEDLAGSILNKLYAASEKEEEQSMEQEQQMFTTEVAVNSDMQISSERQNRAAKLTQQIMANGKIAANSMIEMGRDLKAVRDERLFTEMGYENFEEYCEKKIGIGKRHGYNFIQIYEKFGEEKLSQFQQFGITKLLEIAKLDDEDADDLLQNNDVNALSVRELSAMVDEYRNKYEQLTMQFEEEKSKNAESASLESQVEELKRFIATLNDNYNKALKEKAEAIKEHQSEMKKLTNDRDKQINELKKKQTDYEELEQRYKEIASRPAEISEEERNELIQQGRRESAKKYNDEVEKLKAENAALQSNAQNTPAPVPMSGARDKVKFYFTQIQAAFNAAAKALDEAEESEQETLRKALNVALDRMKEDINA